MESTKYIEGSAAAAQSCHAPAAKSGWLSSRNVLIGAIGVGGGGALFFGWDWLVAAGLAAVIIGVLPCLAMCALGLCMSRMGKKDDAAGTTAPVPPKKAEVEAATASDADSQAGKRAA
jgi:hypothetical protein